MRPGRGREARGFTLVELLIVVAVTTMGFVALADLQTSSLRGMSSMRRMMQAVNLAENFIEDLRLEFSTWTNTNPLAAGPTFPRLELLPTGAGAVAGAQTVGDVAPGWVIGDDEGGADRRVGVVGDLHTITTPLGQTDLNAGIRTATIDTTVPGGQQHFCLLYRLTWLVPNRAIRAEVEVQWPLDSANMDTFVQCNILASNQLDQVRSINLTSTIMVNLFNR